MWRFVFIFLVCVSASPFLPGLLESQVAATNNLISESRKNTDETEDRVHQISINRQGHFVADAYLNNFAVDMLVDTGATVTALPESVAEDIGIFLSPSDFKYGVRTANGTVYGARAVIDGLRIGEIRLINIEALVLEDESLGEPLLGMSVLNQLKRFDISDGTLLLVQ
ncbi:MAG: TIGR02281 family clan AA aspartic protease [Roseibium sp.]|uniref:retropepsin-like aspartic protease family protein n=1 Tax=Roseibium sp. TaxID=1936156 RepID=UPI00261C0E14|nr:TIGR02281 family clan AA aspartic protease [Roseibium sp.]MCV0424471.1 TIGR02281 family clan AA aspartic protease [Roseibium sp.]